MLIGIDASRAFTSVRTGTENYSYQLIKAIAEIDKKNQYILYSRNCTPGVKWPQNFQLKTILNRRLWTQLGLANEILFNPPDVLFIPAHTMPVIRRPGLKTVVTIHDLGYEYLPQYHKFPHKLYLNKSTEYAVKNATHLIAVSEATKLDLIKKLNCPAEKITVVYEGFDNKKFSPKLPSSAGAAKRAKEGYILFVGTLQPRKNIERLIEAFAKVVLSPNFPKSPNLLIAGNKGWMYEGILSAPKRFGIEDRVKFLGYTKEDDLPDLYRNALAFCLPSLFEGFGLPVLEAMACGCPVVVSKNSSLPEVAGDAGLYVDPLNIDDIARNLELIIYNVQLRNEMSKKSLLQAQKFSWEKCARETINVLQKQFNI